MKKKITKMKKRNFNYYFLLKKINKLKRYVIIIKIEKKKLFIFF